MDNELNNRTYDDLSELLKQSVDLLPQLQREVANWEGCLSEDSKKGPATLAIEDLQKTKIYFSNPANELIPLTAETFQACGVELSNIYKLQIQNQFDFYYMTLNVNLFTELAVSISELTCQLKFGIEGQEKSPLINTIFPEHKWTEMISAGIGMDIAINGNLSFDIGVDDSVLNQVVGNLPEKLKANVSSKSDLKAESSLKITGIKYEWGHPEIQATGEGSSTAIWRIQDQNIQKVGKVKFIVVFKVPKDTEEIILDGITVAEIKTDWLTAPLEKIWDRLSDKLKFFLNKENISQGDQQSWKLTLPRYSNPQ